MHQAVGKILIVAKPNDAEAASVRSAMTAFLAGRGVEFDACEHRPDSCLEEDLPSGPYDLVMVLGGDGTFIGTARRLLHLRAPFMGVNLGRVGFLAQLRPDGWLPWLETALADGVEVEERLVLAYDVVRNGRPIHSGLAVNDLVVSRGELARLIRLGVEADGVAISSMRADGLIVSTPTGSSAYGVSAGGPLLHTGLKVFCATPVCPFLNGFKPMVFPEEAEVVVRVEERGGEVYLTEDGQSVTGLRHGDEVTIRRAEAPLQVVDLGPGAYYDKLKKHGFLTER
ncbi:NAD(+)/NADH kinase [Pseudodesulfovibrio indicus]|uniref:NAD kinase n=1 Tax=Pseudodesulfovibrio indicus TaxID=1716143 RepID=A0A126QQC6_9BACT|nr:NAD(+)/NADH kinase [Pseudodesulfovibrio indicus]AMK12144.1 ATP-NAD kinase [Pseudodesulfovibrio indicus]TDT88748.1 NAD+ kinase [Pseudodesulfovibrio indicus]